VNVVSFLVRLVFMKHRPSPQVKVSVNLGEHALGHPLGATGAMLLGTLIDELERRELRYGLVTLCVGGGMGIATVVERLA
jgi:acetyl-CoA C-acetyltransferase